MTTILSWFASLITAPLLNKALDGWKAKLAADNDADKIAADLAARELEVQHAEIEAQNALRVAQIGKWYEPEKIMGYTVAIYFAKLLIWDKVLGWGATDGLTTKAGDLSWAGVTATTIIAFYFGKRTFENVAKIIKK